jgi:hypothetical protein
LLDARSLIGTRRFRMLRQVISRRLMVSRAALVGLAFAACGDPAVSSPVGVSRATEHAAFDHNSGPGDPNSAKDDTKAFIGAWLNGEPVELRYTRSFFCNEPPESIVDTHCEIGALPEDFPRGGRIPTIYALAPAFMPLPDPSTLHCSPIAPCANHPPMIDVTRLHLPVMIANSPAHSHIITSRQAGWHNTVNIRVFTPDAWNQIAKNPTLATVEALQGQGLASGPNPTNIFFFFEVHSATP